MPTAQRQQVGERPLQDPQAMFRETQVRDHRGIQQADRIAGYRVTETGMEFLRDRRAADDMTAFQ